ncbi:glycosyltransferase family 4 protein [Celeribacter sp.]|uniref:glycosyltransferase family 4 protein n=1 Tax=Celeribacter sp. TaxID=1890673 RepID=UPI003A932F49
MRILHVTPTYYPNVGGIEAVIRNMCRELRERGHDVAVAHLETGLSQGQDRDEECDFPIYRIPLLGHRLLGLAPGLRKIAKEYDILHVHDPQLMAITGSVLLYARIMPRVLSSHGFYGHTKNLSQFKALHQKLAFPRLLKSYHSVLAASKSDFAHASLYADNIELFENGINVAAFAPQQPLSEKDLHRWIYWGRISQNKRPDLLVDLVKACADRGHNIHLTITGRPFDDMQSTLKARLADLDMPDHFDLRPPMDDAALKATMAQAGVFASASEYEGFGLTFIEAMAAGLGIICRDAEPMSEFANSSGAGIAVDFRDVDRAAAQVCDFLDQHANTISASARRFAAKYNWSDKICDLERVYDSALSAHNTPSSTKRS